MHTCMYLCLCTCMYVLTCVSEHLPYYSHAPVTEAKKKQRTRGGKSVVSSMVKRGKHADDARACAGKPACIYMYLCLCICMYVLCV